MFAFWKEKMFKNNDMGSHADHIHNTQPGGGKPERPNREQKGGLSFEKGSHVLFPGVVESFKYNKVIPAVERS